MEGHPWITDRDLSELEALPEELEGVLRQKPPGGLVQFVFCGLFVGVLRYVVDILEEHENYPEARVWQHARDAILDYQAQFPELQERFELFDLFEPEFIKVALNRNRIFDEGYGDAPGRPYASLHGTVTNVLAEVGDKTAIDRRQPNLADD